MTHTKLRLIGTVIFALPFLFLEGIVIFQAGKSCNDQWEWSYFPDIVRVEASSADTAPLLEIADKLADGFLSMIGCGKTGAASKVLLQLMEPETCNVAIGNRAGELLTSGSRDVLIGPGAGHWLTTESNRVVVGNMLECDVRSRRCWYLGSWRVARGTI